MPRTTASCPCREKAAALTSRSGRTCARPDARIEEDELTRSHEQKLLAVRRPHERARLRVAVRRPPGAEQRDAPVARDERELQPVARSPGGSDARAHAPTAASPVPSPATTCSRPVAEIRDARVGARTAPARERDARPRERPAHGRRCSGSIAASSFERCRDHVQPVRRPRRLRVVAEPPLGPVGADDPRARRRRSRAAGPVRAAGRARAPRARSRSSARTALTTARPGGESAAAATATASATPASISRRRGARAHRLALRVGGAHDRPRALLARRGRPARARAAASAFTRSTSSSRSSPRRSRELTVPRGRSSSSAISPGV